LVTVHVDVVLVPVVAFAVLLGPAGILVLLPLHVRLLVTALGLLTPLDLLVFITRLNTANYTNRVR